MRVKPSWMGLVSLLMKTPKSPSLLPLWALSEKMAESAGALILNFSAFRTVRNKCFLFKPPSLWYFYYNCPNWLRHKSNPTFFFSTSEYAYPLRVLRTLVRLEIKRGTKISSASQRGLWCLLTPDFPQCFLIDSVNLWIWL